MARRPTPRHSSYSGTCGVGHDIYRPKTDNEARTFSRLLKKSCGVGTYYALKLEHLWHGGCRTVCFGACQDKRG